MKTPEEWMRDFESKIADARAKAAAIQEGLENAGGTMSSDDGSVTVTVAPNGALTDVKLSPDAMRKSHAQLSAEIMAVARKAQRSAAAQVAETFQSVHEEGSETYQLITRYLPQDEEEEETDLERPSYLPEPDPDDRPAPQARPRAQVSRRDGTDDEFDDVSIFDDRK